MRPLTERRAPNGNHVLSDSLKLKRIMVTRSLASGERLVERLTQLGAKVVWCPCVAVTKPNDDRPLKRAAHNVSKFDWLVFTSVNAVDAFSKAVIADGNSISALRVTVAVVGQSTASAAATYGWNVAFVPENSSGTALGNTLPSTLGTRILLPRADIASTEMPAILRERGFNVTEVVAYHTIDAVTDELVAVLRAVAHIDAVTFTSPSTVRHLSVAAKRAGWSIARAQHEQHMCVVCLGETTANEVLRQGWNVDAVARDASQEGLIAAVARALAARSNGGSATNPHLRSE